MTEADTLTYQVKYSRDYEKFMGTCLEFPGLQVVEPTPDDAILSIRSEVRDALFRGEKTIPHPQTFYGEELVSIWKLKLIRTFYQEI